MPQFTLSNTNITELIIESGVVENFEITLQGIDLTIVTSQCLVGLLAELEIIDGGETLHLKDMVVYAQSEVPISGVLKEVLKTKTLLFNVAQKLGFKRLQITGMRHPKSSSANPGHLIDLNINLTYKRFIES